MNEQHIEDIISALYDLVQDARALPLGADKCILERDKVLDMLETEIAPLGIAEWQKPVGGYFVSLNVMDGTAKETYRLAKEAGVTLTDVGATYPYGIDPRDSNIRIAPTFPSNDELMAAMEVLVCCTKLAATKKLLGII